jgi:hypothetical protein
MPLPLPNLDDRTYADLVDEGHALIPRYAPNWTDHNAHDPGITILELLAWLTEMTVYRLNQVPERHRRKFLEFTGFPPQKPRSAHTILSFAPEDTEPFVLPAGVAFLAAVDRGTPVPFCTRRELTVGVLPLAAVQIETYDTDGTFVIRDRTRDWRAGIPFAALGTEPRPGSSLYLGFRDPPTGVPLTLAWRFQGPGNDAPERQRLIAEATARQAACRRILPEHRSNDAADQAAPALRGVPPHHSAQVVWEYFTGDTDAPWQPLEPVVDRERPDTGQVMDDTRALTLDGIVEINLPATAAVTTLGPLTEPYVYVRCRLASGAYDASPMLVDIILNGVIADQSVPIFQSFPIPAHVTPGGSAPTPGTMSRINLHLDTNGAVETLTFLDPADALDTPDVLVLDYQPPGVDTDPAGPVVGAITLAMIQIGVGTGQPDQQYILPQAPVLADDFRLYTHTAGVWQTWTWRPDLDASRQTDAHFVLDATSGQLTFGNGERGRMPPAGVLILAAYHTTRAEQGNVAAGTRYQPANTFPNALLMADLPATVREQLSQIVTNQVPASGGANAETLTEAAGRAVEVLHANERLLDICAEMTCQSLDQIESTRVRALKSPSRATNLLDLERLALDVPGTHIARARAWTNRHPAYPCLQAPGVITLIILPELPRTRPQPSPGLLAEVQRYLDRRRTVTTRLEVVGPVYLEVSVLARITLRQHTNASRVQQDVHQALNAFLDSRRGGPDGRGWPFGRNIYRSEILQVIDGVPGVDYIRELRLRGDTGEPQCGNLSLCPTSLVTPGTHQIEIVEGR